MNFKTTLVLFILLFFSKSYACNCPKTEELKIKQITEYEKAECIFIGQILEIDSNKNIFTIKVVEPFKGSTKGEIYKGNFDPICGPNIDHKGKWLIYGNLLNNNLSIINCGLSRSFKKPEMGYFKIVKPKAYDKMTYWDFILKVAKEELKNEITLLRKKTTLNN